MLKRWHPSLRSQFTPVRETLERKKTYSPFIDCHPFDKLRAGSEAVFLPKDLPRTLES
jgi:hypothetical protein